jgi:hypothetical protein
MSTSPSRLAAYAKAIVYIALTAVAFLVTAVADNVLTVDEVVNLAVLVVGAIGVYWAPNLTDGPRRYTKAGVAFAVAGLVALLSFLNDGVTLSEWLQVILAAFAGIGVYIVPNESAGEG